MSTPILSLGMWVSLPIEVRNRIRVLFDVPRSQATEVDDGRLVSDGTTHKDFEAITIEKMQKYLNDTSDDFHKLFDKVVAKINDIMLAPMSPSALVDNNDVLTS